MRDNIWTRQRKLHELEDKTLEDLRSTFKGLATELDNDDWTASAVSADILIGQCQVLQKMEPEIEDVDWLVGKFDEIGERMEKLEGEARQHGWKAHD
jgi:hypothetical protein